MDLHQLETLRRPVDRRLFFTSPDPLDLCLGMQVTTDLTHYPNSRFVLVSCSQDEGVRRNNGRPGAARAPDTIRRCLYKLATPPDISNNSLLDLGDTSFEAPLEEIHDRHGAVVEKLLQDGKTVIVLGGGNDISYPDATAVQSVFPDSLMVNIDAHLDIRKNTIRNSGTPYRQLIEDEIIKPDRLVEFGFQPQVNSVHYLNDARNYGIQLVSLAAIHRKRLDNALTETFSPFKDQSAFIGFDMDSVKAADAPGVSASSPTGLTAEEAIEIVDYLADCLAVRLFEITEVNPVYDRDDRTAKLAAVLVHRFIEKLSSSSRTK